MAKRNLIFLIASICIVVIAVGFVNSNWTIDPNTSLEVDTPDNSTTNDNTDTTNTNSTTNNDATNTTDVSTPDTNTTNNTDNNTNTTDDTDDDTPDDDIIEIIGGAREEHEAAEDYIWDSSDVITVTLNIDSISVDKENGTIINETTLTITSAGTYSISGTLYDGQIIVDTSDEEVVRLILNGVDISSNTHAPIIVESAKKTVIVLADGTENYLADNGNNEDDSTLRSKDDLTIYGNGALTVIGNANDAIRSNRGLIIKNVNIEVTSVDDGIYGKDYLLIKDGDVTVNSVGDGLKSVNIEYVDRGYIAIEDSVIDVTSSMGDAITAQTNLTINGGIFTLTSGGGSNAILNQQVSTKGLKAGARIVIDGGDFSINSCDDAINSNEVVVINNGTYDIASGDDGICADIALEINNGTVDMTQSFEGLESAVITINDAHIQIVSSDDGISAKDYLVIKNGEVTVNSVGDGLKSENAEDEDKGYISIEDSVISVTSTKGDAITAQTDLTITDGVFTLTSGGGSNAAMSGGASTKGLKAGVSIVIGGGYFNINSYDDAINSNDEVVINDGTFDIATGDDGIHADTLVEINGGTIDITQSFEGIESTTITINNGHIELVSSDDGIQVGSGDFFGGGWGGGGGGGNFVPEDFIYINGGFILIDSGGDGLDAEGYIEMNGGVVIINGPERGQMIANGAIDRGERGSFKFTGGTLVAAGSSDMSQGPTDSSTLYSVLVNFDSEQSANTLINIQTASGETLLTYRPPKRYQSIVFASPELTTGPYEIYLGGSSTGTLSYGIYEDGTYTPGTLYDSFTITDIATIIGDEFGWSW